MKAYPTTSTLEIGASRPKMELNKSVCSTMTRARNPVTLSQDHLSGMCQAVTAIQNAPVKQSPLIITPIPTYGTLIQYMVPWASTEVL